MNRAEIIDILTAVQAIDHRTVGNGDITMWGTIIGHFPKDDAMQAVLDHIREQPGVWIEPGHIYTRVRAIRRDRWDCETLEERNVRFDELDERLKPRILEITETWSVPDEQPRQYIRRSTGELPAPLSVPCPYCHAAPGHWCTAQSTKQLMRHGQGCHPSRADAAITAKREHDAAVPLCTVCNNTPLISRETEERGTCDRCENASTPQQPDTEIPERNHA